MIGTTEYDDEPPLGYSVNHAVARTGFSRDFILRAIRSGRLDAMNISQGERPVYTIPSRALETWYNSFPRVAPDTTSASA